MRALLPAALLASALAGVPAGAAPKLPQPGQVVIGVVESGGVNVLHSDYRTKDGKDPVFPPGMPKPRRVVLPTKGTFEERKAAVLAGPLGNLEGGTLYHVAGTRLLIYAAPEVSGDTFADASHMTGTTSSAAGLKHGTDPDALVVSVRGATDGGWDWLARQSWIDVVSTSYFNVTVSNSRLACTGLRASEDIAAAGRVMFSAAGNAEQVGMTMPPSGLPATVRVGAVDRQGRPRTPLGYEGTDPYYVLPPSRLYEVGELYEVPAADYDAIDGSQPFGGTSAATPRTAGRAARLLRTARTVLRTPAGGVRDGALAYLGPGGRKPASGPLADGRLTRDELVRLMHHAAVPALPDSPGRYYAEGFGAFLDPAQSRATEILLGRAPDPSRPDDDAAYARTMEVRRAIFGPPRCG